MESRRPGGNDEDDTAAETAALHRGSRNATSETDRTSETSGYPRPHRLRLSAGRLCRPAG